MPRRQDVVFAGDPFLPASPLCTTICQLHLVCARFYEAILISRKPGRTEPAPPALHFEVFLCSCVSLVRRSFCEGGCFPAWLFPWVPILLVAALPRCVLCGKDHSIESPQKALRRQVSQGSPIQTESNWAMAAETRSGSLVQRPASKLRFPSLFMPMPAPVRLAEPM